MTMGEDFRRRLREGLVDLTATDIVDELFPEDEDARKPPASGEQRQYGKEREG